MENNTGYALGIGAPALNEEAIHARMERVAEKKELQQNVERVAKKLIEKIEANLTDECIGRFESLDYADALRNIASAVTQMESYAETPLDMFSNMSGLLPKLGERHG